MSSQATLHILGNAARDAFFSDKGSTPVARFSIAHNPIGKDRNGNDLPTVYVDCVAFGRQAEVARDFIKTGTQVAVVGRLKRLGLATDKDGKHVLSKTTNLPLVECEIDVIDFTLAGKKPEGSANGSTTTTGAADVAKTMETGAPF